MKPAYLAAHAAADDSACTVARILDVAHRILPDLERGSAVDTRVLRQSMENVFGGSDATGAWDWKGAYEACEAAQVLFLKKFGKAIAARPPATAIAMMEKVAALLPTHTRRSEQSQTLQQFSTPLPLAYAVSLAAQLASGERVLEPSAGTGLLAVFAELGGAPLHLNELAESRARVLETLFPDATVTRFDAAHIHDHLDTDIRPSVVLMNPPFSAAALVEGRVRDTALRHVSSAFARLADGGRLVAITGASLSPHNPAWRDAFAQLQGRGRIVFTARIAGSLYAQHGTHFETRLTVIDRVPAEDAARFPDDAGVARSAAELAGWIDRLVPPRAAHAAPQDFSRSSAAVGTGSRARPRPSPARTHAVPAPSPAAPAYELAYETSEQPLSGHATDSLYEPYALQSIRIPRAAPHPTALVQSAAMASVAPPTPRYRPHLPAGFVEQGLLSDAQLETLVYAGEAHSGVLTGAWTVDETFDNLAAAPEDCPDVVRFRRGYFLGDGTGVGKGRQVAGIILDNWLKGRRRALWISKSDKLIEDAQRDWAALGQERLLITPLSRFKPGKPVILGEGILFTTYATLRAEAREGARLSQIVDWLGRDFDGVMVFDEAHGMQNAMAGESERGDKKPSQQGRAGLRLQHALPNARVVYVSATGATSVHNLAYAQRLGLWGGADFPFATRAEFVEAIEAGGVAAMEVLARDLKALGLYAARSLSYEGVEYELVEHRLTDEQIRIYDSYAGAFEVIHNNLNAALKAANITGSSGTLNRQAKAAARSAFESAKQRFFNHLITAMKTPTLIASIERDLAEGHAAVVQIVSTGEALMERRLADIPTDTWNDVDVDITPREYVLDYLAHGFPTQLHEPFTDEEGNLSSRPAVRDGQPVQCREAVERRDRLIEHLAALPPVLGALDQIVQRFGTHEVAEITGRSRRIVRTSESGVDRYCVETRAGAANLAEAQAFMDDEKRVLVFSDAGGTGRSYHADRGARNQRRRMHYLLEAGWRADTAIQGLGRSNRTNEAQPPLFRPVATNIKAEKRFLSTIARRLDSLGAITRGQRQTGGQGLFRAEDNLESHYARDALLQLYRLIFSGKIEDCSLAAFEAATGLALADRDGSLREDLPPITTFLNRLLALRIHLQDVLFGAFEDLLTTRIEGALASGVYDIGIETLTAESLRIAGRSTLHTHATGARTEVLTIARRERNQPLTLADALALSAEPGAALLVNTHSHRAAVRLPARSVMLDDGSVEARVRLIRPMEKTPFSVAALAETNWREADRDSFSRVWEKEVAGVPAFAESQVHIVAGLLLPVWRSLPTQGARIYRLTTDDGERIIGRLVPEAWVAQATGTAPTLGASDAFRAVLERGAVLQFADGLHLRRSRVMDAVRIELTGFSNGAVDRLKAMGLFSEIIAWRLRIFVPTGPHGADVLAAVMERHPLRHIAEPVQQGR